MIRQVFLPLIILMLISGCVTKRPSTQTSPDDALLALADNYYKEQLLRFPWKGTFGGLDGSPNNKLFDRSLESLDIWHTKEDVWYKEAKRLKKDAASIQNIALLGLIEQELSVSIDLRICRNELWKFSHYSSWHDDVISYMNPQPIMTNQDKKNALDRFNAVPSVVDVEIANMRKGLALGYSTPKSLVRLVIKDIEKLLKTKKDESILYDLSRRANDSEFSKDWEKLVTEMILPSYAIYLEFLKNEYLSKAREAIGLNNLPNDSGLACYLAYIKNSITLDVTIEELKITGQAYEHKVRPAFYKQIKDVYNANNFTELYENSGGEDAYFQSEEEYVAAGNDWLARLTKASEKWFFSVPKIPVVFKITPEQFASSGNARYNKGNVENDIVAEIWAKYYENYIEKRSLGNLMAHEGIPGHHMQDVLAANASTVGIHPLASIILFPSFNEGWGKYAEMLVNESDLFSESEKIIHLQKGESFYENVQIDMDIHLGERSRQQTIDWIVELGWNDDSAKRMVDRFTAQPGQIMSYLYGSLEILRLRHLAEKELGDTFDIREFHAQVLHNGTVPLNTLREVIDRWVSTKKAY